MLQSIAREVFDMPSSRVKIEEFLKDQVTIPAKFLRQYTALNLDEKEAMFVLQLHCYLMEGNSFPTPAEIAEHVSFSEQTCSKILRKLMQNQYLIIKEQRDEASILSETYSLEPLWEKVYKEETREEAVASPDKMNIFLLFEQEFGRPLSPFEIETMNIWIDEEDQEPSLIKAALREAVLMGKLNFKYIDRILREWKKKGVRTVEQARNQSKSFHANQKRPENEEQQKRDVSLYYNWLEDE